MKTTRKHFGLIVVGLALAMALAGCDVPHLLGLRSSLHGNGTSSETSMRIDALPDSLTLTGEYSVDSGSLRVVVRNPVGETVFDRTFQAGDSGELREPLVPMLGEWHLEVTSPGAVGSYEVWLGYWSDIRVYQ